MTAMIRSTISTTLAGQACLLTLLTAVCVHAAEPRQSIVVPRTDRAPTLDGKLAKGEWDDAAATTGLISQFGGVAHPRRAVFWLAYDATNLFLACRSSVFPEEQDPQAPRKWSGHDSSIVLGLAPGRVSGGTTPSHFLLRANIKGQLSGREIFWTIEGGGPHHLFEGRHPDVKLRHPHPGWKSGATVQQTLTKGVWVCELSIPLDRLKAADAKDGEEWGLLLARDYSGADQAALTLSSDWRFGDGWGHYGRAFYNNYRLEDEYGKMTLGGNTPAVQLRSLGDFAGGKPAPVVVVKNTTAKPLRVTLQCRYRVAYGIGGPGEPEEFTLNLRPGERKGHRFAEKPLPPGETSVCEIRVSGPGGVLLEQEIPIRPGWGKDRAAPKPDVYFSGYHSGRGVNYVLPTCYDPIENHLYCRTRPAALADAHRIARGSVTVVRSGESKPAATVPIPLDIDKRLVMFDNSPWRNRPAAVLEWVAPAAGTVTVDMEAFHPYPPSPHYDGTALRVLHFSAAEKKNTELVKRQVISKSYEWYPFVANDVNVGKGDKIHFYYDRVGQTSCDTFHLRGTLTLAAEDGAKTVYNPGAEFTPGKQGGATGAWFYRWDDKDDTPNADGEYPELPWGEKSFVAVNEGHPGWQQAEIYGVDQSGYSVADAELPDLAPGVYEATVRFYGADGRVVARSRQTFIRYEHRKDLPWLFKKAGVSSKVLPPWTPMSGEACRLPGADGKDADGYAAACWGRTNRVDGSGLSRSLTVLGEDILATGVQVQMKRNGKRVSLERAGKPTNVKRADHAIAWQGALTGEGWRVETAARMEYDGYVAYRMRIVPPHQSLAALGTVRGKRPAEELSPEHRKQNGVDSIRLLIPLKAGVGTHLHAVGGEWFRNTVSSIRLGDHEGVLWKSDQNCGGSTSPANSDYGKKLMTVGSFRPYVWVGSLERGLAFMADSDEGWVPDDTREVPAIMVVRGKTSSGTAPGSTESTAADEGETDFVALVLNLVARPFTFDKPREIAFSLQATPIRPRPDDHRQRLHAHVSMAAGAFAGNVRHDQPGWSWNGQEYMKWDMIRGHGSTPTPPNWDLSRWYTGNCGPYHNSASVNTPYQGLNSVMTFAEVEHSARVPGLQASDAYGYLFPHIAAGLMEGGNGLLPGIEADTDYRMTCYKHWIEYGGLKGMYFDLTHPNLAANPRVGVGYVLDLPDRPALDGKVQPGFSLTWVREFYRRLRTLFVESGVDEPYIWLHSTDANMVSAFAFADVLMDGENKPTVTEQFSISRKIAPGRQQAMRCSAGGLGYTQLGMFQPGGVVNRDVIGWFMLHDVEHPGGCGISLNWAGLDLKRPARFLPYWQPGVAAALKTSPAEVYASGWLQDGALRVVVYNRNSDTATAELDIDLAALGIENGVPMSVTVPVLKRNYRLFKVDAGLTAARPFTLTDLDPEGRSAGELKAGIPEPPEAPPPAQEAEAPKVAAPAVAPVAPKPPAPPADRKGVPGWIVGVVTIVFLAGAGALPVIMARKRSKR